MARRRTQEVVHENSDRWLLTYADLITLLSAFFIMMYGISKVEQKKLNQFRTGVEASLGVLQGGRSAIGSHPDGGPRPRVVPSVVPAKAPPKLTPAEKIHARMARFVERERLQGHVSIAMEPDGAIIRLTSGGVLFDAGTADLKPRARQILEALFVAIRPEIADNTIRKIRVEGHTDNVPIQTTRFPSNWQLSTTRATNVVQYLAERHALLTPCLEAAGCADMQPVASNTTPGGRTRNRRIEIRVLQANP